MGPDPGTGVLGREKIQEPQRAEGEVETRQRQERGRQAAPEAGREAGKDPSLELRGGGQPCLAWTLDFRPPEQPEKKIPLFPGPGSMALCCGRPRKLTHLAHRLSGWDRGSERGAHCRGGAVAGLDFLLPWGRGRLGPCRESHVVRQPDAPVLSGLVLRQARSRAGR